MSEIIKRKLGKSNIEVSALGFGCWPIGGPFYMADGTNNGYSGINDNESIRAVTRAVEIGVNFFDTSDVYGAGHSEKILGQALKGKRDKVVIATKFGYMFDEKTKKSSGLNSSPEYIKKALEESLRRLETDYIDLYQLHIWSIPEKDRKEVFDTLEGLKKSGLIREYGWSTDDPDCINYTVNNTCSTSIQFQMNVFMNADNIIKTCEKNNLAGLVRSPLAMGLLSGKYNKNSLLPKDDIRGNNIDWNLYYNNGRPNEEFLNKIELIKEILTSQGRSLVQGALAWIWGKSEAVIPIPGFRTVKQVEENAGAMEFGPLNKNQMDEIESILSDNLKVL